ncbi:hypothetical protein Rs2_29667 [Raphanus sativus]|nr:hypothetical protein Rs2_29667 [Raphanus sativus]
MLNGEDAVWPVLEPIIQDIFSSLSRHGGITVGYYPRSGNNSADRIAKEASTFTSFVPKLYSMSSPDRYACGFEEVGPSGTAWCWLESENLFGAAARCLARLSIGELAFRFVDLTRSNFGPFKILVKIFPMMAREEG